MISFYNFHSRNKRGMLVIAPEVSDNIIVRYLKPLQNEKLPDGITFNVVAGKKCMILLDTVMNYERKIISFYAGEIWNR